MQAETITKINPLVHNRITTPSGINFSSACFAGDHWSLAKLYTQEDAHKNAAFAEEVACALHGLGATRVYAPTPTDFNGKVIGQRDLMVSIVLPYGVVLYRNGKCPADATYLKKAGEAGVFSAGGCGMVAVAFGDNLLFAHAGRESLLDREYILTQGRKPSRGADLVDNLIDEAMLHGFMLDNIYAWPMYFIKPAHFVHRFDNPDPKHRAYNRAARLALPSLFGIEYGWTSEVGVHIDLPRIARAQFIQRGVPARNICMDHAYLADELPTTRNGGGRYLVTVVRH